MLIETVEEPAPLAERGRVELAVHRCDEPVAVLADREQLNLDPPVGQGHCVVGEAVR